MSLILIIILIICLLLTNRTSGQLDEGERIDEYHARNYQWPPLPSEYIPNNSPGWRSIFERRFEQIARIDDEGSKYNGYMSTVHSALLAPNFTEYGWGLTRAPPGLVEALVDNLKRGLDSDDTPEEEHEFEVDDEYPLEIPLMVPNEHLNELATRELKPIHEAWSGAELIANNAYGLRVYRNQSNLQMHVDQSSTHVISSILHVGHDPEGEPWPLVIEDLHGNTNEVFLRTGDMLLYESSKCFHGRPGRYNGRWYSSLFTHYYPVDWDEEGIDLDAHYRIPPGWHVVPERTIEGLDELVVTETSLREPECKHEWCGMESTTKWESPAELEFGQVVSGDGKIRSLGLGDLGRYDAQEDGEKEL
eukprot:CAMPEP_0181138562 /NCGR_PEP_ID=MMETSP1071-20121207/34313_1 /TAXON_ID=35127 /ORGANISM="Thalassiosira sp., Strain NH16" /LENGTH=361 /DNA_ID=CAMNT_0023225407 /DNA_START=57 /DNA_END=1142 /DNA_ORIENTATION=+